MAEEIINGLQNLIKQINLKNVFKTMNLFMETHHEKIKENISYILAAYKPSNDLEKLLRIRLIDRYNCYEEVINILKNDDSFYISHVLQCSWFFENSKFDPQLFIDHILPCMSYSTRLKVLKKYSKSLKDPEVALTFYKLLQQRYGLSTSLILLPACDESFVKTTLESIFVQVPIPVLLSLSAAYPSIVVSYLTHLLESASTRKRVYRTFSLYSYEKVFILLASREPKKFAVLMEKYHKTIPYLKLGRRSTKQLVNVTFDSIKKNVNIYNRILNWKFVVSCLSLEQISELQLAMFPKTAGEFFQQHTSYCDFVLLTSSLKDSVNKEILLSNFQKAYNKPINDYLGIMDQELMAKLPKEMKEKWVESKLPEIDNPQKKANYVAHLPSKKSIPMLKKMIEGQDDVTVRSMIVNCMFKTIKVYNEHELIGDICQFVVKRLRNDRTVIRENVINQLSDYKRLIEIGDSCWEPIEELINLMILNNEVSGCLHQIIQILSVQIHSRLKRNLPIDDHLDKLLKISTDYYSFDLCKNTTFEKQCLKWFLESFPERNLSKKKKDDKNEDISVLPETLFIRICQWNTYHKTDRIDLPVWLNQLMEKLLKSEGYHYRKKSILDALKKDESLKHDVYNKIFPNYIDPGILTYLLHSDPELVTSSANQIMKMILKQFKRSYHLFFKQAKLYPASNLPDIISNHCIKVLRDKRNDEEDIGYGAKKNSIQVLSVMLPTYKFVEIISDYYPKQSVIDDYTDEGRELFEIQSEIASCLKYVNSPSEILESLRKFTIGDYLKLVVGSLTSICLRTPEVKILPLLQQWLDCPVSLRKHFIRAFFRIAPIFNTREILSGLFDNEKNTSLRLLLFQHAKRFFFKEPSSETFSVLKLAFKKMGESDDIEQLFYFENVPDDFISEYLQLLWEVISLKNEVVAKENRNRIISLIDADVLWLLNEDFCDTLITEVFDQNSTNLTDFTVRYLLYSRGIEQLHKRTEKVMSRTLQLLTKWNDFDLKAVTVFKSRKMISNLVESLLDESFKVSDKALQPYDVIKEIKMNLLNCLQENDILEEILIMDISIFFHNTPDNSELIYLFSKYIEQVIDRLVTTYSNAVVDMIFSAITKVLTWYCSEHEHRDLRNVQIQLSENLFNTTSKHCFIVGLKILPTDITSTSDINKYKNLLVLIFQNSDPTIKLFANNLYKELSSSVQVE